MSQTPNGFVKGKTAQMKGVTLGAQRVIGPKPPATPFQKAKPTAKPKATTPAKPPETGPKIAGHRYLPGEKPTTPQPSKQQSIGASRLYQPGTKPSTPRPPGSGPTIGGNKLARTGKQGVGASPITGTSTPLAPMIAKSVSPTAVKNEKKRIVTDSTPINDPVRAEAAQLHEAWVRASRNQKKLDERLDEVVAELEAEAMKGKLGYKAKEDMMRREDDPELALDKPKWLTDHPKYKQIESALDRAEDDTIRILHFLQEHNKKHGL